MSDWRSLPDKYTFFKIVIFFSMLDKYSNSSYAMQYHVLLYYIIVMQWMLPPPASYRQFAQ